MCKAEKPPKTPETPPHDIRVLPCTLLGLWPRRSLEVVGVRVLAARDPVALVLCEMQQRYGGACESPSLYSGTELSRGVTLALLSAQHPLGPFVRQLGRHETHAVSSVYWGDPARRARNAAGRVCRHHFEPGALNRRPTGRGTPLRCRSARCD